ncbi:MAG: hypothetical protein ABL904_11730 [Hyphomicrobiaceae bacterium]
MSAAATVPIDYRKAVLCAAKLDVFSQAIAWDNEIKQKLVERRNWFLDTALARGSELKKSKSAVQLDFNVAADQQASLDFRQPHPGGRSPAWDEVRVCLDASGGATGPH